MATHSSILAWRISWTEEPGGRRSTGSQEWDTSEVTEHAHMNTYALLFIFFFFVLLFTLILIGLI